MAVSAQEIDRSIRDEIARQKAEREAPIREAIAAQKAEREDAIRAEIEEQKRIRNGEYPLTHLLGIAQSTTGATENLLQMVSGFASAIPGAAAGVGAAIGAGDISVYPEAFAEQADKTTYEPRTAKGKRYEGVIADTYNEYINEKWDNHVSKMVEDGTISPAEGAYYRTSADALLLGLFMKAGSYARALGGKAAEVAHGRGRMVDLDAGTDVAPRPGGAGAPLEGEVIPAYKPSPKLLEGPQKKLPSPQEARVAVAVRQALESKPEQDISVVDKPIDPMNPKAIFKNRQAGAVDPEVFIEVAQKVARPAVVTAKGVADLSHALARQVAFKHVTDIRKINSPTAKMLADRIMPLEDSKIPLGGGYHELISLKEGEYNTRIENVLEPLRRHVMNRNAAKSLRVIALPKRVNDAIFKALDTGKVPENLAPAVLAIRAILDDALAYQQGAGVDVAKRPNYMQHIWNANKIARAEFGKKRGGDFTRYLMEKEGLTFDAAQEVIATISKEEGFLDFIEDTGGRLKADQDFNEWAGRVRNVGGGPSIPGHTKQRVLKGNFEDAKEWLVSDVESVLTGYVNRAVRHAEYTRIAGPREKTLNKTVLQIIEEQQFHGQEGGKLKANSPHITAQEIYDVFDAMQGRFHQIKTPSVRKASRAYAGFQVIHKLALVALAQFPETMMPAARYRAATATKGLPGIPIPLKSYGVGMVDSLANAMSAASVMLTGKRVIPKTQIRQHLERIGVIYTSSLQSSASRMAGTTGVITNRAIRGFGMEAITNLQRTVTYDTLQSMIRENARALAKGTAQGKRERMYRQELKELGIDPEIAIDWYRNGMPKDHPISTKFDLAYVRGGDTTIIMPKAANAPRLYNDPRFQLPLIFTRFFTVFGNTVLKSIGKKLASGDVTNTRKLASIGALLAAVGIAYYTQFLREDISGYEYREEDDPLRIVDAIDRSGLTAMFTRLYPLFSAYKYGQGSQYLTNIAFGPAGGDVAGFIEAAKGSNEQRARWMAKMTPIMTVTPESEDLMYEFYLEMIDSLPEGH